jgi:rRNA-processing protein FCF1
VRSLRWLLDAFRTRLRRCHDPGRTWAVPKIIDTNILIDGRVMRVLKEGFLDGPLVVPSTVVVELWRMMVSEDPKRQQAGRRGLRTLLALRTTGEEVRIHQCPAHYTYVDGQMARVAKRLGGKVLTEDRRLGRKLRANGVQVLSVNGLVGALKITCGKDLGGVSSGDVEAEPRLADLNPRGSEIRQANLMPAYVWGQGPVNSRSFVLQERSPGGLLLQSSGAGGQERRPAAEDAPR